MLRKYLKNNHRKMNGKENICIKLNAGILPAVLVICVLMLLALFAVYMTWSSESLFVAGINYRMGQYANMESACVVYRNDSTFIRKFERNPEYRLYAEDKSSVVQLTAGLWGLYEMITLKGEKENPVSYRLLGNIRHSEYACNFYYPNDHTSVIITGHTAINGEMCLPVSGIRSGQIRSEFFSGTPVDERKMKPSGRTLPPPLERSAGHIKSLFEDTGHILPFKGEKKFAGNNIEELEHLPDDALVIARKITVKENAVIKGQLFATDTILIKSGAVLEYPGGIFLAGDNPGRYIEIEEGCIINGYVIVDGNGKSDINYPNYRQSPGSEIRGMVYINGIAILHGCIKGPVFLQRAIFYSDYGYYNNTIYNAVIEENDTLVFPLWLNSRYGKKEIKWLEKE